MRGRPGPWRVQASGLQRLETQKKSLPISSWPCWHLCILRLMKGLCLKHCSLLTGPLNKPRSVYRDLKLLPHASDPHHRQWAINRH